MMYIICIFYNISFVSLYVLLLSHPMRVRGLKFVPMKPLRPCNQSHPMRVRGLKSFILE